MLRDHPSTEDLEGFLRDASQRGHADRNAVILRHLLASCAVCRDRLTLLGWSGARLENLVYLPGGRPERVVHLLSEVAPQPGDDEDTHSREHQSQEQRVPRGEADPDRQSHGDSSA